MPHGISPFVRIGSEHWPQAIRTSAGAVAALGREIAGDRRYCRRVAAEKGIAAMRSERKKERQRRAAPRNADQGVLQNSTWPTLPRNPCGSVLGALPSTAS